MVSNKKELIFFQLCNRIQNKKRIFRNEKLILLKKKLFKNQIVGYLIDNQVIFLVDLEGCTTTLGMKNTQISLEISSEESWTMSESLIQQDFVSDDRIICKVKGNV